MYTVIAGVCAYFVLAVIAGMLLGRRLDGACDTYSADTEPDPLIDMREGRRG